MEHLGCQAGKPRAIEVFDRLRRLLRKGGNSAMIEVRGESACFFHQMAKQTMLPAGRVFNYMNRSHLDWQFKPYFFA